LDRRDNVVITEQLNELPVKTYRWLKVNGLTLPEPLELTVQPYPKAYLTFTPMAGLTVQAMPEVHLKDRLGVDHAAYGVSPELVSLSETQHNAGVQVHAGRGVKCPDPIVVSYQCSSDSPVVVDHNVIYGEGGSSLTVIFQYTGDGSSAVHNGTLKVYAQPGAEINVIRIQHMPDDAHHFDSIAAFVGEGAQVNFVHVELGGALSAVNYKVELQARGALDISGAYFGGGKGRLDLNYLAEHYGEGSSSQILIHGALQGEAKKIFRGTIDLKRGARGSKGRELESVLLLDERARSIAVPLLLAGEDDVEGEHAASAGKVDAKKLHYLMARGLSERQATQLLVEAAFQPVLDRLPSDAWRALVRQELGWRLSQCPST
jgi:Fe-S cluster assembly protein SufD